MSDWNLNENTCPLGVCQSMIVMEEIYLNSQIKWYTLFVDLIFFVANFNSNSNSNSNSKNFNSNFNSNSKKFNSNSIPIQLFFQTSNSNSNSNSGIGIGIAHQFQFLNWIDPMMMMSDCYFIMPRYMCVQNLRVTSAFLHIFFRTITTKFTPWR